MLVHRVLAPVRTGLKKSCGIINGKEVQLPEVSQWFCARVTHLGSAFGQRWSVHCPKHYRSLQAIGHKGR
ncbi:MAG: hypothetical protein AB1393_13275, partial [Candidatus Edwardsbacteria bacterium]